MDDNRDGPLADPPTQLQAFVRGGRITAVPAGHRRRLLALRRYLVDEDFPVPDPGRWLLAAAAPSASAVSSLAPRGRSRPRHENAPSAQAVSMIMGRFGQMGSILAHDMVDARYVLM